MLKVGLRIHSYRNSWSVERTIINSRSFDSVAALSGTSSLRMTPEKQIPRCARDDNPRGGRTAGPFDSDALCQTRPRSG
jgi:hypothetical protein